MDWQLDGIFHCITVHTAMGERHPFSVFSQLATGGQHGDDHCYLDEIIRVENSLIELEDCSQEELDQIKDEHRGKSPKRKSRHKTITVGIVEKTVKVKGTKGRATK
ncbi:MAG TPA: hypothetical protein VM144_04370 [Aestuariivirga sp.]|nr:hypothetical protein [Aestuariivirga sp.]